MLNQTAYWKSYLRSVSLQLTFDTVLIVPRYISCNLMLWCHVRYNILVAYLMLPTCCFYSGGYKHTRNWRITDYSSSSSSPNSCYLYGSWRCSTYGIYICTSRQTHPQLSNSSSSPAGEDSPSGHQTSAYKWASFLWLDSAGSRLDHPSSSKAECGAWLVAGSRAAWRYIRWWSSRSTVRSRAASRSNGSLFQIGCKNLWTI